MVSKRKKLSLININHVLLGQLLLKIPWKSLYTSPTIISVEDIFILVQPNLQVHYDAEKEEKMKYESKKKEIEKIEAAKKAEEEKGILIKCLRSVYK